MSVPAAALHATDFGVWSSDVCSSDLIAVAVLLAALVSSAGLLAVTVAEFVSTVPLAVFGGTRAPILKLTRSEERRVGKEYGTRCGAGWLNPEDAPANAVPGGSVAVTG